MKKLNVGLIGAGFMGKAHSMAYSSLPMHFGSDDFIVHKKTLVDISEKTAAIASRDFGFEKYTTDWREVVNDPEIDIIDIVTPNGTHAEIAIAAARAGKHILCEKPLARNAIEAEEMLKEAKKAGVIHGIAYNYRRVPAVALAKKFLTDGSLGKVLSFRGVYSQDWCFSKDFPYDWHHSKEAAGSGAIGDIGTHAIDMARFLVGEISEVIGMSKIWIPERRDKESNKRIVDVDDQVNALLKFTSGSIGNLEVTRNAWGRKNHLSFEINCEKGSLYFDYEKMMELQVCFFEDEKDRNGWKTIQTGKAHPYGDQLWQDGIGIGYADVKSIEMYEFIKAVAEEKDASPSFEDGYKACAVVDAILESIEKNKWVKVPAQEE